jgi:hypothetical protein
MVSASAWQPAFMKHVVVSGTALAARGAACGILILEVALTKSSFLVHGGLHHPEVWQASHAMSSLGSVKSCFYSMRSQRLPVTCGFHRPTASLSQHPHDSRCRGETR